MTYSVDFKNIYGSVSTIKQKNTSAKRWLLHELHSHLQSIVNVDKHNLKDSFKEKLEQSLNPAFSSIKRQVADFLYKTHNIHQHIESIQQIYFLFSVDMKMVVEKMLVSKPQHWQIRSILFDGLQKSINADYLEIRRRKETGLIFDEFELLFNVIFVDVVSLASKPNYNS
ncbi:hypothetical protein HK103_003527 [Boothiomyces macroporosus]|uniref:Uncharacterized protein n=1 Tax=Boothiomyces macroporosus TaxID=261099 RepID=A0AAD5UIQ0_9FUNG|nr:hypothetical protein HK103_003527 [Boothiomyces macroporosus]